MIIGIESVYGDKLLSGKTLTFEVIQSATKEIFKKYQSCAGDDPEVFIFHACNEDAAKELEQMILAYRPDAKTRIHWVGPVVGIYTGVGCVGISFKEKSN